MSWEPPDRDALAGDPGPTAPPAPSAVPAQPAPARAIRRSASAVLGIAIALLLLVGIGTAVVVVDGDDDDEQVAVDDADPTTTAAVPPGPVTTEPGPATTAAPTTAAPPTAVPPADVSALQAAVLELSTFVAETRGAPFPGPVAVELLDGVAFNERLLADFEEEREDIDLVGDLLAAMGLLDPDDDLFEIYRDFLGVGVLGFYDPETGELVVRGAELTTYTRSTIVHELTHAYDDQRFELDRPALDEATDESGLGFSSLVEGNAVRVQQAWEEGLSDRERDEMLREQLATVEGIDFGRLPPVLLTQVQFPYTAGPFLVGDLLEAGGEARLDAAFASPPTTSEQVIDPAAYLAGEGPLPVEAPPAEGEVIDAGTYGQLTLRITLGDVVDRETARAAAEGWGGDAYVAWYDGDRTCVRTTYRMDTEGDLVELVDAWEAWAEERPGAVVAPGPGAVTVTSCG